MDPCEFYAQNWQAVINQKVLLWSYKTITKISGLLEINEHNCLNFEFAKKVMSRFLFTFFFQGRDMMFDTNAYARYSLAHYERDQDGLGFLLNLIRDSHPQLCSDVTRTSITQSFQLPTFTDTISIWDYISKCQVYFQEVKPGNWTQIYVLQLVHDQVGADLRLKTAADHLQDKIGVFKHGDGSVPDEYTLKYLARTIMDCYGPNELNRLSQPLRKTNIRSVIVSPVIKQMQTR